MTRRWRERRDRVLSALARDGVRELIRRRSLRRRHGLVALGEPFTYQIGPDVTFGRNCRLGGPAYITASSLGDYTYVEVGSRISHAQIGRFCSLAPYAMVGLAEHPTHMVGTHPFLYRHIPSLGYDLVDHDAFDELRRTTLGHDVWVGTGAIVRGGVHVGHGAVIGAGAVVTSDVPPYAIYAGVPARLVRYRFDPETVAALLEIQWWYRDRAWLERNRALLRDVPALVARYRAPTSS